MILSLLKKSCSTIAIITQNSSKRDGIVPVVPTSMNELSTVAITLHNNTNKYLKKDVIVPEVPTSD